MPEGVELEFLPARSPELQPAERLWPLVNERAANRLFEDLDELEGALVERCMVLSEQPELLAAARATTGGRRQHRAMQHCSGGNRIKRRIPLRGGDRADRFGLRCAERRPGNDPFFDRLPQIELVSPG